MTSVERPNPKASPETAAGTCPVSCEWPVLTIELEKPATDLAVYFNYLLANVPKDLREKLNAPKSRLNRVPGAPAAKALGDTTSNGPVSDSGEQCTWIGTEYMGCDLGEGGHGIKRCDKYRCPDGSITYVCGPCQPA